MTTWTKELPKESGWFWYRESGSAEAEPALFQWRGDDEVALPYLWRLAPKPPLGGMFYDDIDGEFWPERILSPTERFTLKVKPEMWKHLNSLFAPGNTALYVHGKPTSVRVELDPNHPHA